MSYPINYPTPQGANIQIFNQGGTTTDWVKPQGASFVWFTLIGGGGAGDGSTIGGGSGAVTNCMVPAFLIPDELKIFVGLGFKLSIGVVGNTVVYYQQKNSNGYVLLQANGTDNTGTEATAASSNYFSCMGFYQSIAGQAGSVGSQIASATTFLSGGNISGNNLTANYGYGFVGSPTNANGIFQTQPIIVGAGGTGNGKGGIGCGGGVTGNGGDGLVVIITW